MKPFLAYLIFSVLLLICYFERKSTCPSPKDAVNAPRAAATLSALKPEIQKDTTSVFLTEAVR